MRILYGGTFDPVHEGHLAIARAVARAMGATVHLVPSADPPHRQAPGASARQRAHMLALAVDGDPALAVDLRELRRVGPSFTSDTLAQVRQEIGPEEPLVWVLGLDSMAQLHTWHDWQGFFDKAHLLAVQRPGTSVDPGWLREQAPEVHREIRARQCEPGQLAVRPAGGYAVLPIDPLRVESASEVRRRVRSGLPLEGRVPAAVAAYVDAQDLYRTVPGG